MRETADEQPFLLADLPPSQGQNRLALVIAFGVTVPFTNIRLPRVDAFPTLEGICVVSDLVTSALLFAQFPLRGGGRFLCSRPAFSLRH
jgi:hypothetical protein